MKFEVRKCKDIHCKYIDERRICPEDDFDMDMCASCCHPNAPQKNSLGCDDEESYLDIPHWCPRKIEEDLKNSVENVRQALNHRYDALECLISGTELPEMTEMIKSCIKHCWENGYTKQEIAYQLHEYISGLLYEVYTQDIDKC